MMIGFTRWKIAVRVRGSFLSELRPPRQSEDLFKIICLRNVRRFPAGNTGERTAADCEYERFDRMREA